jgi:hypothetical protein
VSNANEYNHTTSQNPAFSDDPRLHAGYESVIAHLSAHRDTRAIVLTGLQQHKRVLLSNKRMRDEIGYPACVAILDSVNDVTNEVRDLDTALAVLAKLQAGISTKK